jgi:hypothetical protein
MATENKQHTVNPVTDRCVRCGRNAFNRKNHPLCMTTGDYVEKWNLEEDNRKATEPEEAR